MPGSAGYGISATSMPTSIKPDAWPSPPTVSRWVAIKPDYYRQSHFNLANALSAAGQIEEAEHEYAAAGKILDADPDLHNNRAVALMRLVAARTTPSGNSTRALELDPEETSARINLLDIALKRGHLPRKPPGTSNSPGSSPNASAHRVADAIATTAQRGALPPVSPSSTSPNAPANSEPQRSWPSAPPSPRCKPRRPTPP